MKFMREKCLRGLREGVTLNSCRVAIPLKRLLEGEERLEASDHPQDVLPINCGATEQNRTVTWMVLKAAANDRRIMSRLPR
ncbi:hypothetical protein TNCV_4075341 [Trichonephila clavipes]|nr:hypothetical protein TNCV_4075341 [Trichonephila clavipes]